MDTISNASFCSTQPGTPQHPLHAPRRRVNNPYKMVPTAVCNGRQRLRDKLRHKRGSDTCSTVEEPGTISPATTNGRSSSSASSSTSSHPVSSAAFHHHHHHGCCCPAGVSPMQRSFTPEPMMTPESTFPSPMSSHHHHHQQQQAPQLAPAMTAAIMHQYRVGPPPPPMVLTQQLGVKLFDLPVGLPDRNMAVLCKRHLECPGSCTLGPQLCPYRHITRGHSELVPTQQCIYYHQSGGTCRKEKCGFFHGPTDVLQHMQRMQMQQMRSCLYLLESVLPIRDAQADMEDNLRAEAAAPPPPYSLAVEACMH